MSCPGRKNVNFLNTKICYFKNMICCFNIVYSNMIKETMFPISAKDECLGPGKEIGF